MVRSEKAKHVLDTAHPVRDAEVTQAKILAAAEEEFARHGLVAARTERIAAQTHVVKAMIHYYFKSKEGLYQAVLERAFSEISSLGEQLDLEQLSPKPALKQYVRGFLACLSRNPNLPAILFYEAIQNRGKYYKWTGMLQVYTTLAEILEQGMAIGVFRTLEPRHAAINIVGVCIFYFTAHENLKHLWRGKQMLSPEMLDQHAQEAITTIMASVQLS
ncbi:MAG: TetR/AcrR family transcriptional regulator [Chroococcidiopsidaceae cyanobacterium CP_BM_ER_R8_30]|nr:TetR/AcrR family transcriptional regulator [Chroococcidiopsidaceae cyanobacterium CP_BM_ER_R8_30]